ncbi:MAG: MATE family efflux transporter [Lentisphaeria bacterium]|nr:MATE family efflux transporter [Lentisphaeria bacterium]
MILADKTPGSVRHVLSVALPLVLSSLGHALNLFTDRVMLTRFSESTMAAAFPAGLTAFAISCFFIGIVGYSGSFVAQYEGAKMYHRVGPTVWQGIFLALTGGVFMLLLAIFAAPALFRWFGHAEHLQVLEVKYFRVVGSFTVIPLLAAAFAAFWGGRAKTLMVMIVNLTVVMCNIPFNYLLIYGHTFELPLVGKVVIPQLGIVGAGIGTVLAGSVGLMIYLFSFFSGSMRHKYHTAGNIFDWELFRRIVRYGLPNGVQMFLDLTAFNAFVVVLGKVGPDVLAASGIAFSANALAFTPMVGLGQSVSILSGQAVGARDLPLAERSVRSALLLVIIYTGTMGICFTLFPQVIFMMFGVAGGTVAVLARKMLWFITGYLIFDGLMLVYSNAIKGAGDTRFAMWTGVVLAWLLYALPCAAAYWFCHSPWMMAHWGEAAAKSICVWTMWSICVIYIVATGVVFYWRYHTGKWKKMRVIEDKCE